MKTAVCFSGAPRSLQYTHENLKRTFDDAFGDYDVYAHVPQCDTAHQVVQYFPQSVVNIAPDRHIDESNVSKRHTFKTGAQAYLQQINGWKEANTMRKLSGVEYDFVVRCRMDILFTSSVPEVRHLHKNIMYIPDFHHYGGVNDRFCIAGTDIIDNYCDIIDLYHTASVQCAHAETFLSQCLARQNTQVQFVNIRFDRMRQNGVRINDTDSKQGSNNGYPQTLTIKGHL